MCLWLAVVYIILTLSPLIPLRLYTLPCWSNPPFLIFDIWVLWHSGPIMVLDPSNSSNLEQLALKGLILLRFSAHRQVLCYNAAFHKGHEFSYSFEICNWFPLLRSRCFVLLILVSAIDCLERLVSIMSYYVLCAMLNPTHSLC